MERYKSIKDIDTNTDEGKLILASVAIISTSPGYTDKTPDEVLQVIVSRTDCFNEDCEDCIACEDAAEDRGL